MTAETGNGERITGVEQGSGNRLTGISSMAMRQVLAELADAYERQSGQAVAIVSVGGVDAARRVYEGEAFDFVVLAADAMEQLAAGGRVDPGSTTDIARSAVAIAVAAGATRTRGASETASLGAGLPARSTTDSASPCAGRLV